MIAVIAWNTERTARIESSAELGRLREIQQILQAPGTKQVQFGPQPAATPHGSVFVNGKLGMILIAEGLSAPERRLDVRKLGDNERWYEDTD